MSEPRCIACEAKIQPEDNGLCEDHQPDEDNGPSVIERIDWTKPCPAPLRCAIQTLCPPACRRVGNREGNHATPEPEQETSDA